MYFVRLTIFRRSENFKGTCSYCLVFVFCEGFSGTPGYLSPEMINRENYGRPIDVWACGRLTLCRNFENNQEDHVHFPRACTCVWLIAPLQLTTYELLMRANSPPVASQRQLAMHWPSLCVHQIPNWFCIFRLWHCHYLIIDNLCFYARHMLADLSLKCL